MKLTHLSDRINDYRNSITKVVKKKLEWNTTTKPLLLKVLKEVVSEYHIGWKVQELNWIHNNESVNITFDSFPPELIETTNLIPTYQFYQGGALIFSQTYNGDIYVFIALPVIKNKLNAMVDNNQMTEVGLFSPKEISERFIIEKIDMFLKEMIQWELPNLKNSIGY